MTTRLRRLSGFLREEMGFLWLCMRRPSVGFDAVKWSGRGSIPLTACILAVFFLSAVFDAQLRGFIFNTRNPDTFSVISTFAVWVGGFLVCFTAHYAVSSVVGTEARPAQMWIVSSYALCPYILLRFVYVAASNLVSMPMGVFLRFLLIFGGGWSAVMLLMGMFQVHQTSFGIVLANMLLTALGVVVILFFMLLLYSLFQQLYTFFYTIFSELMFRV